MQHWDLARYISRKSGLQTPPTREVIRRLGKHKEPNKPTADSRPSTDTATYSLYQMTP